MNKGLEILNRAVQSYFIPIGKILRVEDWKITLAQQHIHILIKINRWKTDIFYTLQNFGVFTPFLLRLYKCDFFSYIVVLYSSAYPRPNIN